jgi:hypothetical protein
MRILTTLLILGLVLSCKTNPDNSLNSEAAKDSVNSSFIEVNDDFDLYLDNFERTDLPIIIKGCEQDVHGLKEFDGIKSAKYNDNYSFAFRQIPTNGTFIATVTLGVADCYLPVLTTYKLTGEKIDSKTISIGYCGSDCGYTCSEFMRIDSEYNIYVSDSVKSYECDSLGYEIPGTKEEYVIYKRGKLLTTGKIELSEEIKDILGGK